MNYTRTSNQSYLNDSIVFTFNELGYVIIIDRNNYFYKIKNEKLICRGNIFRD